MNYGEQKLNISWQFDNRIHIEQFMPPLIIWTFLIVIAIATSSELIKDTMILIKRNDWLRMNLIEIMKIRNKWYYDYKYTNLKFTTSSLADTDHQRTLMQSYTQFYIFVLRVYDGVTPRFTAG